MIGKQIIEQIADHFKPCFHAECKACKFQIRTRSYYNVYFSCKDLQDCQMSVIRATRAWNAARNDTSRARRTGVGLRAAARDQHRLGRALGRVQRQERMLHSLLCIALSSHQKLMTEIRCINCL